MENIICWLLVISEWLESHNGAITAIATVFMAVFTLRLWVSTNRLWQESVSSGKTATTAANTAKESVISLKASERAYVFVEVHVEEPIFAGTQMSGDFFVTIKFWNYGKTPAIIELVGANLKIQLQPPEVRSNSEEANRPLPPSLAIASNNFYEIRVKLNIPSAERMEMVSKKTNLYCVGVIKYRSVLNDPCETVFCWNFVIENYVSVFVVTDDSILNRRT